MFNLHIIDVSALLYFGMNSIKYKEHVSFGYQVGGIHKLMRNIAIALNNSDDIILAFDSRNNFRKKLMPEYKAGRIANKSILSQSELLQERLPVIGIPIHKADGYEGDDIINWCTSIESKYDNVYIHANDQDLIHNVRGHVVFHSITETINSVSESNFPYAIEKGVFIPFNFLSVRKVLTGCKSDKVPAFVSESGIKGDILFNWYLKALEFKNVPMIYENTTNPEMFLRFMSVCNGLTEADLAELRKRTQIIFPAACPATFEIKPVNKRALNMNELRYFLSLVNDYDTLRAFHMQRFDLSEDERKYLKDRQYKLVSGAFAVDRNMVVNDVYDDALLTLKEF